MSDIIFRLMTIADYDAVRALWENTAGMGLNPADDSRGGIEKYLQRSPGMSFIAQADGKIVGALLCGHDGRRGSIYHLAVAESYRGHGVGKKLVGLALEALRKEGIRKVSVVVFRTNEKGNVFWEKIGFEKRGDLVYRNSYTGIDV